MGSVRAFRPFKSKAQIEADSKRRVSDRYTRRRLTELRAKVEAGDALTDDDVRLLARCPPNVQAWVGYKPAVVLS